MKLFTKFIIGGLLFLANPITAQYQFILTLNNGEETAVLVSEIQSIKFESQSLILNQADGNTFNWLISDINNYRFDSVTSATLAEEIETSQIEIYPNPSNGQVVFSFSNPNKQRVSIGIFDLLGQEILMVYSGMQEGKQTYSLDTQIPSGVYICKVFGGQRIWTKSFIVN